MNHKIKKLYEQLSKEHHEAFEAQGGQRASLEILAIRFEQIIIRQKRRLWDLAQEDK